MDPVAGQIAVFNRRYLLSVAIRASHARLDTYYYLPSLDERRKVRGFVGFGIATFAGDSPGDRSGVFAAASRSWEDTTLWIIYRHGMREARGRSPPSLPPVRSFVPFLLPPPLALLLPSSGRTPNGDTLTPMDYFKFSAVRRSAYTYITRYYASATAAHR